MYKLHHTPKHTQNMSTHLRGSTTTNTYKYLGILQPRHVQNSKINKQKTTAMTNRQQKILKPHLNSKNLTKSINTYVTSSSGYLYSILSWSQTYLESLQL